MRLTVCCAAQVRELTSIVRNQVAHSTTRGGQKGLLDDYADVVYRAWRATDGLCRYEVEETLIQVQCMHGVPILVVPVFTNRHRVMCRVGPARAARTHLTGPYQSHACYEPACTAASAFVLEDNRSAEPCTDFGAGTVLDAVTLMTATVKTRDLKV